MRRLLRSLALASVFVTTAALADPPARVGRLSLIEGEVTFHLTDTRDDTRDKTRDNTRDNTRDDTRESAPATLNWPVSTGAALSTAPGARAEVRIGSTAIRLDGSTALEFVQVDDQSIRLRLEYGAVAVRVRSREVAGELVLETRDARVGLSDAGRYRFEAGRAPDTTAIIVFEGGAQVDADGVVLAVRPGRRAEVGRGGRARVAEAFTDGFDDWTLARDRRDDAPRSTRYVSPETTGHESLDEHGDWRTTPEYGPVWTPRAVPAGWAPYRAGRWAWVAPWGWTWVDEAPWGFAPFHYGRWALVGGFWGWVPGAFVARPVFAPALVGWVGRPGWSVSVTIGAVPAVGWFPLAPREAFFPAYRCSTAYVRNVNVTHVTNIVNVTNVPPHYAHRHVERAVTVVPAAAVSGGQHAGRAAVRLPHATLVADAGGTSAPPPAAQPPRHFGGARRDDGGRWARRAETGPVPAMPLGGGRRPEARGGERAAPPQAPAAPPVGAATPRVVGAPASAVIGSATSAASPPVPAERERRRDDGGDRPEWRLDRQAPVAPRAPPPAVASVPPAAAPSRAAIRREPSRGAGDRGSERRFERERPAQPAPSPAAAPPPAPPVAVAPVPPRIVAPAPSPVMPPLRSEPRFAPPAPAPMQPPAAVMRAPAPMQPPAAVMRAPAPMQPPAPAQPPPPQVRAPAPPQSSASPQPVPRPDGNRGQPREARQGERRGG